MIQLIKDERNKGHHDDSWGDTKLAARIGEETGARVVAMAPAVGGVKGTSGYIDTVDYNVKALAQALR
jgi:ABC-type Zn uptake system ZnuABC Zn-binding protein ZnuA